MKALRRVRLEWCYLNEMVVTRKDADRNYIEDSDGSDEVGSHDQSEEIDWLRILQQQYSDCKITNLNSRIVRYVARGFAHHQDLALPQYWRPL